MTDIPQAGIFCFGANKFALDISAESGKKLCKLLKKSGYGAAGYKTMLTIGTSRDAIAKKLSLLCLCSNLVITLGCDGFSESDIIPDITKDICEKEAPFFALHACGACNIRNYENDKKALRTHNLFPSRATAGICNNCLVINLPSDYTCAMSRLNAILPMINFALIGLCGRSAEASADIDGNLMAETSKYMSENYLYSRFQGNVNI